MKTKSKLLPIVALLSLLSTPVPIHAGETSTTGDEQTQQKNECLLLAIKCGNTILSIQDKIEMLKEEIAKGKAVYSVDELNILRKKLEDASRSLDFLLEK